MVTIALIVIVLVLSAFWSSEPPAPENESQLSDLNSSARRRWSL